MLPGQGGRRPVPPFMGLERDRGDAANLEPGQLPYDGRFMFARLRYTQGVPASELGGGRFGRRGVGRGQGPPWSHDYPRAERNFMKILDEITTIAPYTGPIGGVILDIGSPDLMKFPVGYMAEAGYWTQTDEEAANLRAYLTKGGFIIFDDFRGGDWSNFEAQMKRVLPDVRMVELDISHPIFHSFFDVATLDFVQFYGRDPRRRSSSGRTKTTTRRSGCSSSRTTTTTWANTGSSRTPAGRPSICRTRRISWASTTSCTR